MSDTVLQASPDLEQSSIENLLARRPIRTYGLTLILLGMAGLAWGAIAFTSEPFGLTEAHVIMLPSAAGFAALLGGLAILLAWWR